MNHTIEGPQICLNISPKEHQEGIKEAARKARMEVINNLDQESREKLKKQEFQVYTRQKRMNQPLYWTYNFTTKTSTYEHTSS